MRQLLLAPVLLLAACQPAGEPDASAPDTGGVPEASVSSEAPAEPSDRISSTDRLVGEYRIAGVDGEGIDLPYGITASITAARIVVSADCVRMEWTYRFEGAVLVTERTPTAGCKRGLNEVEQAIGEAFDAATQVALDTSNGYEFAGGGHTVTLFTQ